MKLSLTPLPHSPLWIDFWRRSRSLTAMSSNHRPQALLSKPSEELTDESDFEKIISSNGLVSICGFGSLLSDTIDQIALSSWSSLSHFVFWTLIVRSIFLSRTREKRKEYVSRSDQLQSCETQWFLAKQRVDEGEKKKWEGKRKKEEKPEREKERKRKYFLNERGERNLIKYYYYFFSSQLQCTSMDI